MRISRLAICALAMCSVACTSDQVTVNLELAVDAAIAAAPAIESVAGVPPATQTAISAYLVTAQACLDSAATIMATKGLAPAVAAAQVSSACASDLLQGPALPSGTPVNVVAAVKAVSDALGVFLNSIPKSTAAVYSRPEFVNAFAGAGGKLKFDQKRLKRIKSKLAQLRSRLSRSK